MRAGKRKTHKRQQHGEKEEARRETEKKVARREPAEPRDPGTAERTVLGLSCLACDLTVRLWG